MNLYQVNRRDKGIIRDLFQQEEHPLPLFSLFCYGGFMLFVLLRRNAICF